MVTRQRQEPSNSGMQPRGIIHPLQEVQRVKNNRFKADSAPDLLFLLTNIITVTLVALMLFAEYMVRCRTIPVGERSGMVEGLCAYFICSDKTAMSKQRPRNNEVA
ncbi:hypothetical protein [Acidithiobacillus ferrivorans]|uniref:hypothetical protein n=1 Tax=Acidithiobacillus ferrivorans TaxID=160808 RepID=UPI001C07C2BC|nr:hypothetical protein [Acidithiobacillus ferrivorans]